MYVTIPGLLRNEKFARWLESGSRPLISRRREVRLVQAQGYVRFKAKCDRPVRVSIHWPKLFEPQLVFLIPFDADELRQLSVFWFMHELPLPI